MELPQFCLAYLSHGNEGLLLLMCYYLPYTFIDVILDLLKSSARLRNYRVEGKLIGYIR